MAQGCRRLLHLLNAFGVGGRGRPSPLQKGHGAAEWPKRPGGHEAALFIPR